MVLYGLSRLTEEKTILIYRPVPDPDLEIRARGWGGGEGGFGVPKKNVFGPPGLSLV